MFLLLLINFKINTMKSILSIFTLIFIVTSLHAQLENVIVEKYYISDANDAKDIQYITNDNGDNIDTVILEEGSTTYRIYIQLKHGCKLTKVYGDANHTLNISSTANFFNHIDFGASFGKDINNTKVISKRTVALDTWLTLGLATKTNYGVMKTDDKDGSIIGKNGFLINNDPGAGIPLTIADGLDSTKVTKPLILVSSGIINKNNDDSTIFGSLKVGKQFISNDAYIGCNNGVNPASSNKVLIAQLTTKGEISFKLNVQVIDTSNSGKPINFVADTASGDYAKGNIRYKYLSYPQEKVCGCNDPNYLEYMPDRDCDNAALCIKEIIFGCMDPQACNYDPTATNNIPTLCCYPGKCADRDISLVCPDLGNKMKSKALLYPNPVNDQLTIEVTSDNDHETKIEIYNSYGRIVKIKNLGVVNGTITSLIDVSDLENGMYLVHFFIGDKDKPDSKIFIKNTH